MLAMITAILLTQFYKNMDNATKLIELRKKQTQLLKDLASIDAQIFELELLTINA